MTEEVYDIIIVGTGPGGSGAGITAAKSGFKTLILEKEDIGESGRYKACGGALAWELVDEIPYPEDKISRIIESLELHHIDGETYSKKGKGAVVYRSVFDKYLLDLAISEGVEFKNHEGLESISKIKDNYEITTNKGKYRGKYVIAADGVNSRTLRLLDWPYFDKKDLVMTITDERTTSSKFIEETLGSDKVHLYFGVKDLIPMGYAWLFPKDNVITVGWGNRLDYSNNYKADYEKFRNLKTVQNCLKNTEQMIYRGHLIPVGVRPQIYKENVFAVGDAGGFVDPISGKGIPYAMLSAEIAIKTIQKCEKNSDSKSAGKTFQKLLDRKFLTMLKLKKEARERIFKNDESLKNFLSLWEKYRSSELILKKMI